MARRRRDGGDWHRVDGCDHGARRMRRALAAFAASLLIGAANAAENGADFAASKGVGAEAQLRARLKAAVRTLPGTQTRVLHRRLCPARRARHAPSAGR